MGIWTCDKKVYQELVRRYLCEKFTDQTWTRILLNLVVNHDLLLNRGEWWYAYRGYTI